MDNIKCEMCGRPRKGITDVQWDLEYGVFLCEDCRKQVQEIKKSLFGREFPDYRDFIKEVHKYCRRIDKEEEPMKVKVRRDSKEEIEVDVNNLQFNDEFDISKGGEVIATGTIVDTWESNGVCRADVTIKFKKEGKTWKDLGYDCFEDMIDDIAKRHGSLGHKEERTKNPSNYIKIHDAAHEGKKYVYADSFGKSIIRVINDDGSSTIYDADQFQVYLEEEDD